MRTIRVKNNTASSKIWVGKEYSAAEVYTLPDGNPALIAKHATDDVFLSAIANGEALIGNSDTWISGVSNQMEYLKGDSMVLDSLPEPQPFAVPAYRTKRDATTALAEVSAGQSANIDYKLPEERYVTGGTLLVKNAEMGDYISASVVDVDSVIPEPYRAATCENWPIVATYIIKAWVEASGNTMSLQKIDTYPLNAKISNALYLRVAYTAANSGNTRTVAVNYNLTKKL